MKKVIDISCLEFGMIKVMIGEAFVSNELFHSFGKAQERKPLVMKYMDAYVDYCYETGSLYETDDRDGYIALCDSRKAAFWPRLKLIWKIYRMMPKDVRKSYLHHVRQISGGNRRYAKNPHVDVLMVCVDPVSQGQGITGELIDFAKSYAKEKGLPLLFDTDMEAYAQMYQHLGCTLYNQITADNGVTRYNLVWQPNE